MGNFKMKAPYEEDPTSVHEVPFADPRLMGKANKNGTIIINNDPNVAGDPKKRDEIVKHEKHHLHEMIVEKNKDGSPVLDYDEDNVYYHGKTYPRSEFSEGDKELPWEKDAYGADEEIDFKGQLKTAPTAMMGDKVGHSDEEEVSMNESFNPLTFMKGHRGNSQPFKMLQDKGLIKATSLRGPSSYRKPDIVEENYADDEALKQLGQNIGDQAGNIGGMIGGPSKLGDPPGGTEPVKGEVKTTTYKDKPTINTEVTTDDETGLRTWTTTRTSGGGSDSNVAYEDAYDKVDKDKYPTLQSFIDASDAWNERNKQVDVSSITEMPRREAKIINTGGRLREIEELKEEDNTEEEKEKKKGNSKLKEWMISKPFKGKGFKGKGRKNKGKCRKKGNSFICPKW